MKIRTWILIFFAAMISSCAETPGNEKHQLSYLALGDSYTIGESVEAGQRYPVQLHDTLKSLGYNIEMPKIVARTGWTTGELLSAIEADSFAISYDIVTLLIGVNNQYRGMDVEIYKSEFLSLLEKAVVFAGGNEKHVVVISIPDWGVTPFAQNRDTLKISTEIDLYNEINEEISAENGVPYIDITGISREAKKDELLLAADGLHPSGIMYSMWIEVLLPEVLKIIK